MKKYISIPLVIFLVLLLSMSTLSCKTESKDHLPSDSLFLLFQKPESGARAFVRWWWNGNRVNEKEVLRELDLLKSAGFGGVEINPIKMPPVSGEPMQKQLEWLSPDWISVLKTACQGAKERGMIADLLVGSGWPFGGKFLKPDQTIERMAVNYKDITGPKVLRYKIKDLEDDLPGEYLSGEMEKESVRELSFIRLIPDEINSIDQITDLTPSIKDGEVTIRVPAGKYRLAWGVLQKGYREVVYGTLGADGPTMDHFNAEVVQAFLNRLLEIEKELGIPLDQLVRALFADSMELAGSNWCDDLADEFRARCGYSIDPWLPFILYNSRDPYPYKIEDEHFGDLVLRARYDYTRTLVDLFHERFTSTFQKFCTDHGLKCRYQAYGNPWLIGMLDGYMKVDIPESNNWLFSLGTKPDDEDYFTWNKSHGYMTWNKYASSGGHLTGKDIISCEAMTNLEGVFQASLSTIKQAGDMNFITGITHSVLHGFNYSPPEAGFPGWVRYGTYFSEHNTLWPHFKNWLDYDARVSSVLQNSEPVADIAILPPEADNWSRQGLIRKTFQTEPWYVFELWQGISQNGSSCDYVNEKVIRQAVMDNGEMTYGPMSYKTLILADVSSIEPETAKAILSFVTNGGSLIGIGREVIRSSSMSARINDSIVISCFEKLKAFNDRVLFIDAPEAGTSITEWINTLFANSGHVPDIQIMNPDLSLYQIHHKYRQTDIFFIANTNRKRVITDRLVTDLDGRSVWKWNPENGTREPVDYDNQGIDIVLRPLESFLLVIEPGNSGKPSKSEIITKPKAEALMIQADWTAKFYPVAGPEFSRSFTDLPDFKTAEDTVLQNFAGKVVYKASFNSEATQFRLLDLGEVSDGVTEVSINGKKLGKQWYGQHIYMIGDQLRVGRNEIEIVYTSLLSNYCRSLDKIEAKRWIGDRELISNGLIGPVILK